MPANKKEALQKIISQNDYCSRRQAEKLIQEKRVKIDNEIAKLGDKASKENEIKIDNKPLKSQTKKIYIKMNKPLGYTCTNKTFKGEKNVFSLIDVEDKLYVAGRLDKDSEGLIILTNDGYFTQTLTHPKFSHEKKYLVTAEEKKDSLNFSKLKEKFLKGLEDQGETLKAKDVKKEKDNLFLITLTQGKNRQLKRMFKACGYKILNLKRLSVSDIELDNLKPGDWIYFKPKTTL